MEHPFIHSLSDKSIEDLQSTISGLYGKLTYAHRTGNTALINQINMVIESYRNEYTKRTTELMKKQNIDTKINIEGKTR
jgi:hypothetical protein